MHTPIDNTIRDATTRKPKPIPTPAAFWSKYWNAKVPTHKEHYKYERNYHQTQQDTYFSQYKGKYFTGDGARRDKDGYYWVTGRVDDVLNVSGHRIGTAEVESAIVNHVDVAEVSTDLCRSLSQSMCRALL